MAIRAHKVEMAQDPETGELFLPRDEINELAGDLLSTLLRNGGMLAFAVRREPAGESGGHPTFATTEFIAHYNTAAPSEGVVAERDGREVLLVDRTEIEELMTSVVAASVEEPGVESAMENKE